MLLRAGPFGLEPEIWGDLVLVASAGFWSLVMVRQSRHAPNYPAFPLGTYKVRLGAKALLADSVDSALALCCDQTCVSRMCPAPQRL